MIEKSQDKYTTLKRLKVMINSLDKIGERVCDRSILRAKLFRNVVQVEEKHKTAST